jgi:predicted Fe-Mo cluster-binding NifX family protein
MDELDEIRKRKTERMMEKLRKNELKGIGGERMKICVPTMGNNELDDFVSEHFGRAPTFTIVDLSKNEVKVVPNTSEHFGGISSPPEMLSTEGVEVMLCSGLGPRAISMFEQSGIEVYVGASGTVRDAVRAFQAGKLREGTDANACKMHRHKSFVQE